MASIAIAVLLIEKFLFAIEIDSFLSCGMLQYYWFL
jgi:hypothetical protein